MVHDPSSSRERTAELLFAVDTPYLGIKGHEDPANPGQLVPTTSDRNMGLKAKIIDYGIGSQFYDPRIFEDMDDMPIDFDPEADI